MRIAVGGFGHETNTFADLPTHFEDFGDWTGGGIPSGDNMLERVANGYAIQGFAAAAREAGHTLAPLLHAFAPPGNRVARDAFERICDDLILRLQATSADAVYLQLHGAMVAEHIDSADAEVLRRARDVVGAEVPIVVSFDLHGNVDPESLALADGVVAYRTYPHVDYLETGRRTFDLLHLRAGHGAPLHQAFRRIPFLMPLHRQTTEAEPCGTLYRQLAEFETQAGAGAKLSFMTGFPPSDVAQCGPCIFGYSTDAAALEAQMDGMLNAICAQELEFSAVLPDAQEIATKAVQRIGTGRPVILADVQDNPGGGAGSDTTWIVRALLEVKATNALVGLVYDPAASEKAHAAGIGATVRLRVGGHTEPSDSPIEAAFRVDGLHDGPFPLKGPMFAGSDMALGKMALLTCQGVSLVVTSKRTFYIERESFRAVGVDPEAADILVVKSTNHYRADFAPIAAEILEFAAPAAVKMNPAEYCYHNLRPGMRLFGGGPTIG